MSPEVPDTIVDPKIRREVERPGLGAGRPLLLVAIVLAAALAGGLATAMWLAARSATRAPQPAYPRAAPAQPGGAPAVRMPCPSYGQRGEGATPPPSNDCYR